MAKKMTLAALVMFLVLGFLSAPLSFPSPGATEDKGRLIISFRDGQVGYEDYEWIEEARGYTLQVRGKMEKPLALEIEAMTIRTDKSFLPTHFHFKGSVSGVAQEVTSTITEGKVESLVQVSGQENRFSSQIRRDAFLLPNPIFSPYIIIAKKFGCGLQEKAELSAYIIPQVEVPMVLEPKGENPCSLFLKISETAVTLETDKDGHFISLLIPSQSLKVSKEGV
jgi:hypothetical protein